ncbi:protein PFC0760c-like [Helianthus annuus]|uniref:protein PFC0760c-like n=1 Tax=Helianthus annuus TaxID=4232 RepID=UPI000B8FD8FE|nr:protein PFC0760c-like [Helianthus annuus]
MKEHELYMMNKVIENMLGKSIEQRFEEIEVEELRAKRQAEIDAEMKFKGKGVEGSEVAERSIVLSTDRVSPIQNPIPISAVSAIFEEDVLLEDITAEVDEEDDSEEDNDEEDDNEEDDNEEDDNEDKVFSASSHSDDDDNDDDDNLGGTGVKVTEASNEKNVNDYMNDDANEVSEGADGEGEKVDDQNVDKVEKLILRIEPDVEGGEIRHTYTLDEVLKMFNVNENEFKFDFKEELNAFDINHQPEYEYKYVEEADVYDRVEVEDCIDEDSMNEDTSEFPTLMEFFSQENRDELRRKVAEILKDKNFDGTTKDPPKEERKKWFRNSNERRFKRPLKFYQRDRGVSLGDIISWGFLPQVNAYAIRRECGV